MLKREQKKAYWQSIYCFITIFLIDSAIIFHQEGTRAIDQKNSVRWTLRDIKKHADILEIFYEIENLSLIPLWICATNDFKQQSPSFESQIDVKTGELFLKLKSVIVPKNILLEEPLCGRYERISYQDTTEFHVNIQFPIGEMSPIASIENMDALSYEQLKRIQLEVGYYQLWKFSKSAVCPIDASERHEAFINCFWSETHPEQSLVFSIPKQTIEEFVRQ